MVWRTISFVEGELFFQILHFFSITLKYSLQLLNSILVCFLSTFGSRHSKIFLKHVQLLPIAVSFL